MAPDGERVTFYGTVPNPTRTHLILAQADGSDALIVSGEIQHDLDVTWSVGGEVLSWLEGDEIRRANASGLGVETFPAVGLPTSAIQPSPSGEAVAYHSYGKFDETTRSIVVSRPDGSAAINVTADLRASAFDWSPNGNQLAFQAHRNIWIVDADGDGLQMLGRDDPDFPDFRNSGPPRWSPDGTRVTWAGLQDVGLDGIRDVYVYDIRTGEWDRTSRAPGADYPVSGRSVSWRPCDAFIPAICDDGSLAANDTADSFATDGSACTEGSKISTEIVPTAFDLTTRERIAASLARLWGALAGRVPMMRSHSAMRLLRSLTAALHTAGRWAIRRKSGLRPEASTT